uniref:HeH/LEM domain protein n=1 Tax=Pithovirus LCPAC401 TaxID=2506595 RepID=A0A481Z9G8_9VIRU|nr:MAG: HeH/LEM domain protein [Pithovirus LCPAC401]
MQSLTEGNRKYCRCLLKVAIKQSDECLRTKAWGSGKCYSPYAVCTKSVGHQSHKCYYDYSLLSDALIRTWFVLHNKPVPTPFNRDSAIAILESHL